MLPGGIYKDPVGGRERRLVLLVDPANRAASGP